jgi:hypothetical protein
VRRLAVLPKTAVSELAILITVIPHLSLRLSLLDLEGRSDWSRDWTGSACRLRRFPRTRLTSTDEVLYFKPGEFTQCASLEW